MAEWIVCPQCNLRHSRRPDGTCPRCKSATEPGTPDAPQTASAAPTTRTGLPDIYDGSIPPRAMPTASGYASGEDDIGPGARIAGGILLLNGIALLAEKALLPKSGFGLGPASFFSALIDLLIGSMLLTGRNKFLVWARVRAGLGLIVLPIVHAVQGNAFGAGIQVAFSVGILALLIGRAGKLRIGLGTAAAALCLGLEALGLLSVTGGSNPLARMMMAGQLESAPATVVTGVAVPYQLSCPQGQWYLRKPANVHADNPLADRWLVRPDRDAHVIVIAEQLGPGQSIQMARLKEVVLQNARKAAADFEMLEETQIPSAIPQALLLHSRGTAKSIPMEMYHGLFISEPYVIQVIAFAQTRTFRDLEPELREIITSLSL